MLVDAGTMHMTNITILPRSQGLPYLWKKAVPAPKFPTISSSSNIPHTSVMSQNNLDKKSFAFVGKTISCRLPGKGFQGLYNA